MYLHTAMVLSFYIVKYFLQKPLGILHLQNFFTADQERPCTLLKKTKPFKIKK
ncbi:unnamed protein product [Acanthoscelides obtectus]|uniref:Uncharacterized protein n=1 Tax=Acanthoscelides obtectus TaxID=200917 RepID=A0A9P0KC72_ACAOB|nr:unnamed protein product [Acanthoscelides obtectus]CAK1635225.1 hypothetical protein AOBTE_LOCUS9142 [Acanthoscelides obtectus]